MSTYKTRQAQRAIQQFKARFGPAHFDFAAHAALPLALSPDLLYALWFNFNEDVNGRPLTIPWIAVADLLLSPLCQEIGHELYAIAEPLRAELMQSLVADPRFGLLRAQQVAQFLDQYVDRFFTSPDPDLQELGQAQRLAAYAYANPPQLMSYLDTVYGQPLDAAQMIRLATLVEAVSQPIANWPTAAPETKAQFARAQTISQSLATYARGDTATAVATLQAAFATPHDIAIGATAVPLPADLRAELAPETTDETGPDAAADLTAFFADFVSRQLADGSGKLEAALRAVARWLDDPANAPILLITGQVASGKTELAVNVVKNTPPGGYHFCMDGRPETLTPHLFVRSLSRQLADRYPAFRAALSTDPPPDATAGLDLLLERLLLQPLNRLFLPTVSFSVESPVMPGYVLILVDDLDAGMEHAGEATILAVCLRLQTAVPQLRFLLTTHLSSPVRDALAATTYASYTLDVVYQNFDFRIQDAATKRPAYEVTVMSSPAGELKRPLQRYDAESLVRRILDELRHVHPNTPRQPIGADLFRAFFAGEVASLFRASYAQAQQAGERLRLRLFLSGADRLALPWEWLHDEALGFLAQQEDISVVRYQPQTAVFRTRANPKPIEILLVTPNREQGKILFDPDKLAYELQSRLSHLSGQVNLTLLNQTSLFFDQILAANPVHVLHLMVPIVAERDELRLLFNVSGRGQMPTVDELAAMVQGRDVALVVLTAVNDEQWSPTLQAAQKLTAAGIPAVLAWPSLAREQFDVLLAAFYENLAAGAWLDEAITDLRRASATAVEGDEAGADLVLFTSTPHGNVWRSELTAVDLYEALAEHFTLTDLQDLCFRLQTDYDALTGEGRRGKLVDLVGLMQRRGRLQELALAILDARPTVNFAYRQKEATPPTSVVPIDSTTLRQWLDDYFNLEEIRLLCFELEIDFESLPGNTKRAQIASLIEYAARQDRLAALQAYILRQRPSLTPTPQATPEPQIDPVALYRLLAETFTLNDLQELTLKLNVWYDDLAGDKLNQKARELVLYMQRHGRLPELLSAMQAVQLPAAPKTPANVEIGEEYVTIGGVRVPIRPERGSASAAPKDIGVEEEYVLFGNTHLPHQDAVDRLTPVLTEAFSSDDLRTLAFELGVDYENLTRTTLETEAASLVDEIQRQGRLTELIDLVETRRPSAPDNFSEAA